MKKKAIISTVLYVIISLHSTTFAKELPTPKANYQESVNIQPRYSALYSSIGSLSISSKGEATCKSTTRTQSNYFAKTKMELQKYTSNWSTIKKWESTNEISTSLSKTYNVAKGYSYRLKTTHYALDSNGNVVESVVKYSSTVSYK